MSIQRVMHINADSIVPFLNLGNNYAYYWIKNTGAATIYATTQSTGEKEVSELISDYESGNIFNTVKIEPQAAARLFGRTDDMWLYAEEDGLAEIVLDNVAECPFKIHAKGGDVDTKFYPKADCNLEDATSVESDTMRVLPIDGTDYYPYIYIAGSPYPTPSGAIPEAFGKRYNGQTQEYSLTVYVDLIDVATNTSVAGYPQKIVNNWNVSIVDGGYFRIKNWDVNSSGAISVTTTRFNPTYTKPIDDTKTGAAISSYLASYMNAAGWAVETNVTNPQE